MILSTIVVSITANAQVYGRLKANMMHASDAVNSFNNVNMSATTSATNLDVFPGESGDRSTFEVVQSRIGGKYKYNDNVLALLEFDFIDFAQASPTTSAHPRLRRAFIEHKLSEKLKMQIGQDWDLFSGLGPDVFNYISYNFNSGNAGFMRQQVIFHFERGDDVLSFALGQAGKNSAAVDGELENEGRSSLSSRYEWNTEKSKIQISVIGAQKTHLNKNKNVWGVSLGSATQLSAGRLVFESYYGEAISELATLTLPSDEFGHEYGGFLTYKYASEPKLNWYFGVGYAAAEKPGLTTYDNTSKKFTNLGANKNTAIRVGRDVLIDEVKYYMEITRFATDYHKMYEASTLELGGLLFF